MSLYSLENIISNLEHIISESKQVGILYHVCTINSLKHILSTNTLESSGRYVNHMYHSNKYVSFTRSRLFIVNTPEISDSNVLVQLELDGDALSEHYKISPYNDFAYNSTGKKDYSDDESEYREKEEVIKGPIKNISKYIKNIYFDIVDLDNTDTDYKLNQLPEKCKYFNFIKYKDLRTKRLLKEYAYDGMSVIEFKTQYELFKDIKSIDELLLGDENDTTKAIELGASDSQLGKALKNEVSRNNPNLNKIKLILSSGFNLNFEKYVVVKECIYYGKSEVLELFLSYGLKPNVRFASGITALNYAVLNNQTWITRILLDAGANQNLKYKGKTALQIATSKRFNILVRLLIEYQ